MDKEDEMIYSASYDFKKREYKMEVQLLFVICIKISNVLPYEYDRMQNSNRSEISS